jgi:hypothetical protein
MTRWSLLAPALLIAGPAHAGRWRASAEIAGEVDSNVNRAEDDSSRPPEAAALIRIGGSVDGAVATGAGTVGGRLGTDLRVAGSGHSDEDLAVLAGDLRWQRALRGRPAQVGLRAAAYDASGLSSDVGARSFRWMYAEGWLALDDRDRRAVVTAGGRDFHYKPEPRLDWRGPTLGLALTSIVWRGDDADGARDVSSLELAAQYRLELRGYDGFARAPGCPPGTPAGEVCYAATDRPRSDLHHRVSAGATYTGDRVYAAEYELTINDSSSHGDSLVRHRITASATTALLAGIYATAHAAAQIDRYRDGMLIPDDIQAQTLVTIDDDSRSSLSLLLARRLGAGWTAEARWALWTNVLSDEDRPFRRQLVTLGVTWSAGSR